MEGPWEETKVLLKSSKQGQFTIKKCFLRRRPFNRPGVAGAVLQSRPLFIHWVILKFKYLLNTVNPKPKDLRSWNFERMFFPHYVSFVTCHVSHVRCHVPPVWCHVPPVGCHMSPVACHFFPLIQQSDGASRWRVCYQQVLPRLVSIQGGSFNWTPPQNQKFLETTKSKTFLDSNFFSNG